MRIYFKNNIKVLLFLIVLVLLSGPLFSVLISAFSNYLNEHLGDWLGFYGSVAGILISSVIIHFQLSLESEKELQKYRPEIILSNDYQLIKSNCRVYFNDKCWFSILKQNNFNNIDDNSFAKVYATNNKRDKILSLEIVNNQPIFNIHVFFGGSSSSELIPKLGAEERVYIVSSSHMKQIYLSAFSGKASFNHVPQSIVIYFTTLTGEICKYDYEIDDRGYCKIIEKVYGINYPESLSGNRICDYFVSN